MIDSFITSHNGPIIFAKFMPGNGVVANLTTKSILNKNKLEKHLRIIGRFKRKFPGGSIEKWQRNIKRLFVLPSHSAK